MKNPPLTKKLLRWYDANKRDLPWRGTKDPYKIWLSEVMLQQTTVKAVEPRWRRFLQRWPTLRDLARAPLADVLHEWTGLGYYARARNIHKAATTVGDALPCSYAELLKLPGLGEYTAAAVASIAYGERVPLIDANVERVLARVYTIEDEMKSTPARKKLRGLADTLVPANRPGDFNQALMELGATICTPREPECLRCPISADCGAFQTGRQHEFPRIKPKEKMQEVQEVAVVLRDAKQRVLVLLRSDTGSFANLWELPRVVVGKKEKRQAAAVRAAKELVGLDVQVGEELLRIKHTVMRSKIELVVLEGMGNGERGRKNHSLQSTHSEAKWVTLKEWDRLQKSITQQRVLDSLKKTNAD
ncbi:MAG: A/G-specific adenine glycosylase [Candidatus Sumerlaeota bacterium]